MLILIFVFNLWGLIFPWKIPESLPLLRSSSLKKCLFILSVWLETSAGGSRTTTCILISDIRYYCEMSRLVYWLNQGQHLYYLRSLLSNTHPHLFSTCLIQHDRGSSTFWLSCLVSRQHLLSCLVTQVVIVISLGLKVKSQIQTETTTKQHLMDHYH